MLCVDCCLIDLVKNSIGKIVPAIKIPKTMSCGFFFRTKDEKGNYFQSDLTFINALSEKFESTLINELNLDPINDHRIIERLKRAYKKLHQDTLIKKSE